VEEPSEARSAPVVGDPLSPERRSE
jgi:hypothetical protein